MLPGQISLLPDVRWEDGFPPLCRTVASWDPQKCSASTLRRHSVERATPSLVVSGAAHRHLHRVGQLLEADAPKDAAQVRVKVRVLGTRQNGYSSAAALHAALGAVDLSRCSCAFLSYTWTWVCRGQHADARAWFNCSMSTWFASRSFDQLVQGLRFSLLAAQQALPTLAARRLLRLDDSFLFIQVQERCNV